MAVPANTFTTNQAVGNREELSDVINRIAATKRVLQQNIKTKGTTKSVNPSWQTQALRAPVATNKHLQGDDTAATAAKVTARLNNHTQIFKEAATVARTQQSVDAAGRPNEMSYQVLLKGEELLNDFEMSLWSKLPSIAAANGVEGQMAGLLAWMTTTTGNVSRGAGGSDATFTGGTPTVAPVNGTQRAFTETLLKTVLASAFTNGANGPKLGFMSATHKQQFSGMPGIADIRVDSKQAQATIIGAADKYIGDFGDVTTVPVQFGLTRDVAILDPDYWDVVFLDKLTTVPLAKTGDAEKKQLVQECTLRALNEKSSALIADLL